MKIKFDGRGLFTPKPFDYWLMVVIAVVAALMLLVGCSDASADRSITLHGKWDCTKTTTGGAKPVFTICVQYTRRGY